MGHERTIVNLEAQVSEGRERYALLQVSRRRSRSKCWW